MSVGVASDVKLTVLDTAACTVLEGGLHAHVHLGVRSCAVAKSRCMSCGHGVEAAHAAARGQRLGETSLHNPAAWARARTRVHLDQPLAVEYVAGKRPRRAARCRSSAGVM